MSNLHWTTAVTKIGPNEIRVKGFRIEDAMEHLTFAQMIYLLLTGELPDEKIGRLMDIILVSSVDHGATPPSCLVARTSASTGAPLNAALAAGILTINDFHGGAIHDCMLILKKAKSIMKVEALSLSKAAEKIVSNYRSEKKRINGFGHRIHSNDPRKVKLFSMASDLGLSGEYVEMALAIEKALADATGKNLPINVDGAIAALLCDLKIPVELANAFFIMARLPGLVAHIYEEQTREKLMRKIDPTDHSYDGPGDREIKG